MNTDTSKHRLTRTPAWSQAGYSLAEIMIAVGVASIVMLAVGNLVQSFQADITSITKTMDFDEEAYRLQYYFTRPFRTAVNLRATTTNINNYAYPVTGATAFEGRLLSDFDSANATYKTNNNADATAVAIFARDVTTIGTTDAKSVFQGTGIYFQQPSASTYGILYVTDANPATGALAPSRNGQFATNVVRLAIEDVNVVNGFVLSFTVHVWMRYPTSSSEANLNWCAIKSDCGAAGAPTKDVERKFAINLFNNFDPADQKLPMGRIYFLGRGS